MPVSGALGSSSVVEEAGQLGSAKPGASATRGLRKWWWTFRCSNTTVSHERKNSGGELQIDVTVTF
eukprot:m.32302 g.32302  ORF g.32302 m.32302 type:complete len:66 (+) comp31622_c0_seq1:1483-1680(+)